MISFERDICTDLLAASSREWLETNGIGGFASSTVSGMNTRRYHGLLVAATKPPVGRMVLVSKLEETLDIESSRIDLSTNRYGEVVHPSGYSYLAGFRLDPWPIYTFEIDDVRLEKAVFMVHGSNTTIVTYRVVANPVNRPLRLEVRPLIAARDYHSTTHENRAISGTAEVQDRRLTFRPYDGVPPIHVSHNANSIQEQGHWYRNLTYSIEQDRGLDSKEDLFNPVMLEFDLGRGSANVVLSTEPKDVDAVPELVAFEKARRAGIVESSDSKDEYTRLLYAAADQFVVRRGSGHTIIAGYPWFTDWGRDTMVALPGVTISTKRFDVARGILKTFASNVSEGMLPNLFHDDGTTAEYNTVDAALWFFEAVRAYVDASGDVEFARELFPVLSDILEWHIRGTRYGIRVLDDGLLHAGVPGVQLTWMDAKVGDKVITPRSGKPVEIQALWYNALRIMSDLAERFEKSALRRKYDDISARLHFSFNRLFWNAELGCLYDVVNGGRPDASIRPNQVFALSLPHMMVSSSRAKTMLEVVERELLTPLGLRSLSPRDPAFSPRYEGGPAERDSVYHQGTVWPWLLGPFVQAYLKVHGRTAATVARCSEMLAPMQEHLREAGLGQVSEIADATAPYSPKGCFAQAWSVAEILRAHLEVSKAIPRQPARPARVAGAR
jgi:predicted glycogen debranching enzyme